VDPRIIVRPYDAICDAEAFRACIIEQQDFHRSVERSWPEGKSIADEYLKYLETQCTMHDGGVMVAECRGEVVGFVCVVASTHGDSPDDPATFAWIHDIFVRSAYRRHGVATRLMAEAESFSRARGARLLRLGVLEGNGGARSFYRRQGFRDYVRVLTKSLD